MSRVSKKKLDDILKETELLIRENDIIYICDDIEVIKEFIQLYRNVKNEPHKIREFLSKNESKINKDRLILILINNYMETIEAINSQIESISNDIQLEHIDMTQGLKRMAILNGQLKLQQEKLENAKKLGKGIQEIITYYYYDEKIGEYTIDIIDSKEVIEGKTSSHSKNRKRLKEIHNQLKDEDSLSDMGLEFILQSMLLTDLYEVFPDTAFGNNIRTLILENSLLKEGIKTKEEIRSLKTSKNFEEYTELIDNIEFEGCLPYTKEILMRYAKYIDIDKLLLISAYRFNEGLENKWIRPESEYSTKEILEVILNNINRSNYEINCLLQNKKDDSYEEQLVNYSVKDLKKCLKKYANNKYLKDDQIQEYRKQINEKSILLRDIEPYIDIIFSNQELKEIAKNSDENFVYFIERYELNQDQIKEAVHEKGKCSGELIEYLIQNKKITYSTVIELYEKGIVSLEIVGEIDDKEELALHISAEKLNEYYRNTVKDEDVEKYERYLKLYKEMLIKDKEAKEIEKSSNELMMQVVDSYNGKNRIEYINLIKNYYKEGLITLDSILEWDSKDTITILYNESLIDIQDIEELVKREKLPFEYLQEKYVDVVRNNNIEYNERLRYLEKGYISEKDIFDMYNLNLIFEEDLKKLASKRIISERKLKEILQNRTKEELEKNSLIVLKGLNGLTKRNNSLYTSENDYQDEITVKDTKSIIDPNERIEFINLLNAYRANTDLQEENPFYNYEFYVIPDESGEIGLNSVVIAERYYEDKDTEERFAINNATYFFKYKDLMVLSNMKKSEMTKERANIVFTANHTLSTQKRIGHWAASVIYGIAKTMLSSDLKEYSKDNQRKIVLEQLTKIYNQDELIKLLDKANKIDSGEYNCEIVNPNSTGIRRKNMNIKDDGEAR